MLHDVVTKHVHTFPNSVKSYGPLVEALQLLKQAGRMSAVEAGQVAAKLMSGAVEQEAMQQMKEQLAKCTGASPADDLERQMWIMDICHD
jgi:hypothetical protein